MYFNLIAENFINYLHFIIKSPIAFIIIGIIGFLMSLITGMDKYDFSLVKWIIGMVLLLVCGIVVLIFY